MPDTLLLTGATGHVGAALLPGLLADPEQQVRVLLRAPDDPALEQRRARLIEKAGLSAEQATRLQALRGDVGAPGLGLSARDRSQLLAEVTSSLHSAASVRFDMPEEGAAAQNIEGTRHMLELVSALTERGGFRRHDHVSTCYVAGDRKGRAWEHERYVGQPFRNTYEWSKCEAEALVERAVSEGMPIAVHRPSIIVGDSRSGRTESFNVLYWPLKLYLRGWWRTFPGEVDAPIDVVPVDFVAEALLRIRARPESLGGRFHLAAGDEALTAGQIMEAVREITGGPPIRVVSQDRYRRFVRPLLWPFFRYTQRGAAMRRGGEAFLPYFRGNPIFDTTQARKMLQPREGEGDVTPPPLRDYLERVLRYAMERDFGRG
jgi:long-chain acyl-CoA synthetase